MLWPTPFGADCPVGFFFDKELFPMHEPVRRAA